YHIINHLTEEVSNETRNVLVESARIARGNIKDIKELNAKDFDALVLPGGFGAAKNLSSFAYEGENFRVDTDVERVVKDFHNSKKPIAALCIAPVIISKVLGAEVTIGNDKETATIIEHVGGKHIIKDYHEIAIDTKNLIVTNPCYMIADDIYKVWLGAEASIEALLGLIK
ncbi:MAG: isoprenoid biosynthesis glyoxalase ElbB, partial [Bacteroidales bacterium]|nr:isoprenoid biosynthesis glyoxalase ElbB [Bacteroidales bacterium]